VFFYVYISDISSSDEIIFSHNWLSILAMILCQHNSIAPWWRSYPERRRDPARRCLDNRF